MSYIGPFFLPHKPPLLLIDEVLFSEYLSSCHAIKNLTYNEWFFPAHFPDKPIVPGSILIEAATQTVVVALINNINNSTVEPLPILISVDQFRMYKEAIPGDRINFFASLEVKNGFCSSKVKMICEDRIIAKCVLTFRIR